MFIKGNIFARRFLISNSEIEPCYLKCVKKMLQSVLKGYFDFLPC
jgi:hypothetical protein